MEEFRNALKRYMAVRLIVTTVILLVAVFTVDSSVRVPFIALVGIAYAAGIVYTILLKRGKHLKVLAYLQIIVDVVIVSAFVSITQSVYSTFTFLYVLCILAAGVLLTFQGCIMTATLSSVLYSGIIFLEYRGLFNPPPFTGLEGKDFYNIFFSVYAKICAFYFVAFLSASLAVGSKKRSERFEKDMMRADKLSSLGQLSASLIHEVKNPLSAIKSSAEYLQKEHRGDIYTSKLLEIIAQETRRLDQLISQFLNFTRSGTEINDSCRLTKILEDTLLLLKGPISKNIKITKDVGLDLKIKGSPEQIKQVFLNIMLNGLQAMPSGGEMKIRASLTNGQASPGRKTVRRDFSDTGCGIPGGDLRKIFEPFYTTRDNGTGLGLAIVKRIVEQNGGTIDAASEVGRGTTFSICIPLADESAGAVN